MSWTQTDLDAINESIASGSTRVRYKDRDVTYRSLTELIRIRDMIRNELGTSSSGMTHAYPSFSKGLR